MYYYTKSTVSYFMGSVTTCINALFPVQYFPNNGLGKSQRITYEHDPCCFMAYLYFLKEFQYIQKIGLVELYQRWFVCLEKSPVFVCAKIIIGSQLSTTACLDRQMMMITQLDWMIHLLAKSSIP